MAKPTHVRKVAELLDTGDFNDSTDAAKAVLALADELKVDDVEWSVVREHPGADGSAYIGYRGFPTRDSAFKAIEKGLCGLTGEGRVAVIPLYSRNHVAATLFDTDKKYETSVKVIEKKARR